ncbi:MAG TPA: hypothetical protein PKK11_07310 [Methanothrix sp.]|nr:hypothetical protein [Methanothrix sp.]HPT20025.1 hypothetical protein [Methanothrix sp.]
MLPISWRLLTAFMGAEAAGEISRMGVSNSIKAIKAARGMVRGGEGRGIGRI